MPPGVSHSCTDDGETVAVEPSRCRAIGKAHVMRDWTQGCIAVTNEEIEELWRVVPNGTRVEIKP